MEEIGRNMEKMEIPWKDVVLLIDFGIWLALWRPLMDRWS
jgi:hypothetical protein